MVLPDGDSDDDSIELDVIAPTAPSYKSDMRDCVIKHAKR